MKTYKGFTARISLLLLAVIVPAAAQFKPNPVSGELPPSPPVLQYPGEISGVVLGPDGKPVMSAAVTAVVVSQVAPRKDATYLPLVLLARTALDGSYNLNDVPPGSYRICADILSQPLLNTCRWGTAPVVAIGAGSATVPTIRFSAGAKLHVRVNDVIGALQPAAGKPALLEFGVASTTGFLSLGIVSTDAGGRDYEALIPFDTSFELMGIGKGFTFTNAQGAVVDLSKQTIPVLFAAGSAPAPMTLNLTGSAQ